MCYTKESESGEALEKCDECELLYHVSCMSQLPAQVACKQCLSRVPQLPSSTVKHVQDVCDESLDDGDRSPRLIGRQMPSFRSSKQPHKNRRYYCRTGQLKTLSIAAKHPRMVRKRV